MASNHIEIGTTTRLGSQLRQALDTSRVAYNAMNQMASVITQYNGDYAAMAADFGITGANAATQMQAIVTLSAAGWANMSQAGFVDMINKLG